MWNRLLAMMVVWISFVALEAVPLVGMARAAASLVAEDASGNKLILHDRPCVGDLLVGIDKAAQVLGDGDRRFRAADMLYNGKWYAACWFVHGDHVLTFDAAGERSAVPISAFRDASL